MYKAIVYCIVYCSINLKGCTSAAPHSLSTCLCTLHSDILYLTYGLQELSWTMIRKVPQDIAVEFLNVNTTKTCFPENRVYKENWNKTPYRLLLNMNDLTSLVPSSLSTQPPFSAKLLCRMLTVVLLAGSSQISSQVEGKEQVWLFLAGTPDN